MNYNLCWFGYGNSIAISSTVQTNTGHNPNSGTFLENFHELGPFFVVVIGAAIDNETPCFEILPVEMCFYDGC